MLENEIKKLEKKMTNEDFNLTLNIFNEDVEFHKKYKTYTDKDLCEVLGQACEVVERLG